MILKVLLVIAVIGIVYVIFFKKSSPLMSARKKDKKLHGDEMVQCESCEVYVDISEAILSGGKYYCSQECLKA